MKIRQGFVSNSSSSSFIALNFDSDREEINLPNNEVLTIPQDLGGKTEFGWEVEWSDDIASKLNFLILQAEDNKELTSLIKEALKKHLNLKDIKINLNRYNFRDTESYGYIDHESLYYNTKDSELSKVFENEENIINFIFNPKCKILMGNDNDEKFDNVLESWLEKN